MVNGSFQSRGFIKTTTIYFNVIQSSSTPKSLIECCGYCGTIESCQGVKYEENNCTAINNILPNFRATTDHIAWIDMELYRNFQRVILFSGSKSETEIIDLSFGSSHLLTNTYAGAIGGKISDTETMMCEHYNLNCRYFETASHHKYTPLLKVVTEERISAAAIGLPEREGLWIIGGENKDTTEIVTKTGSEPGPPPPVFNTKKHCVVRINSTTIFSIGGTGPLQQAKTWFCHMKFDQPPQNWTWIEGPQLQSGRLEHACITWNIQDKIVVVVVGGYGRFDGITTPLKSTEFLEMDSNQWVYGPDIALNLKLSSMISFGKQNELFLFGGRDVEAKAAVNTIQRLSCEDQNDLNTCQWITLPQKLQIPRSSGILIQL